MAVFILPSLSVGFLIGLAVAFVWPIPREFSFVLIAACLLIGPAAWQSQRKYWLVTSVCGVGLCLGVMSWQNAQQPNQYQQLFNKEINFKARVIKEPSQTATGNQVVYLLPEHFTQQIRVSFFNQVYVKQGQVVNISGILQPPENFSEFNYIKYLQYQGVYAELKKPQALVIEFQQPRLSRLMNGLRKKIVKISGQRLSTVSSALVLGVLVGQRGQLPETLQEAYRRVGLIHILVVSGYNLTIIAGSAGALGYILGRRPTEILALCLIWLFVILVGAESPVVRAGIMASILIASRLTGRSTSSYLLLVYAVVIMAVVNPLRLFYDIGLQLSAMATFGVLAANRLRILFLKNSAWSELNWSSGGAILATAPLIAKYFGTLSLIAPVANAIILPTVPLFMLIGALVLLPKIGFIFVPITELLVKTQIFIVEWLANFSFSQIEFHLGIEVVLAYYCCAIVVLFWLQNLKKPRLIKTPQSDKITKIII